jgi:predicted Zn-dependent peptidase
MLVSAATDPSNVAQLTEAMWACCRAVGEAGISPEEWERVQSGLADGVHIGLQRSLSRARHIAASAVYRGDPSQWQAALSLPRTVDRRAVEALARTLFRVEQRVLVCAGPRRRSW